VPKQGRDGWAHIGAGGFGSEYQTIRTGLWTGLSRIDRLLALLREALRCPIWSFFAYLTLGLMTAFYRHKAPNKSNPNLTDLILSANKLILIRVVGPGPGLVPRP
jgi:hypothetical protein